MELAEELWEMKAPDEERPVQLALEACRPFAKKTFLPRIIKVCGRPIETTPVFDAYWYFAAERQRIFMRRVSDENNSELTADPVLSEFKFTNAYRASDRVSQYLIRNVIYRDDLPADPENVLFRILLFKIFNKIETWKALENAFERLTLDNYDFEAFDKLLSNRQDDGMRNYSAAYIMPSAGKVFGFHRKHSNHLKLIEWMLKNHFARRLSDSSNMCEGFSILMSAPSLGPFLAYQFITDINYSPLTDFSEKEFVVAGPGALDGISKCFVETGSLSSSDIIRHMTFHQHEYFDVFDINFDDLRGRELQLIDCQNLFCEISKYSRVAFPHVNGLSGRTRIKQKYRPFGPVSTPWYPPDWGLNQKIESQFGKQSLRKTKAETNRQMTLL